MPDKKRQIFRPEAVRRYAESRENAVQSPMIHPRLFGTLWGILAVLVVIAGLLCTARVPVYASGVAVVVATHGDSAFGKEGLAWAVFFPIQRAPQLTTGQEVFVRWDSARQPQLAALRLAPSAVLSPAEAQRQFGLQGAAAAAVSEPSRFGLAPFEPPEANSPATSYLGSVRPCQTEISSRSVLSLLPMMGSLAD
jgi:hypothetical protein